MLVLYELETREVNVPRFASCISATFSYYILRERNISSFGDASVAGP